MMNHHGFIEFSNLIGNIAMEFFEFLCMLQNSIQIFLRHKTVNNI